MTTDATTTGNRIITIARIAARVLRSVGVARTIATSASFTFMGSTSAERKASGDAVRYLRQAGGGRPVRPQLRLIASVGKNTLFARIVAPQPV